MQESIVYLVADRNKHDRYNATEILNGEDKLQKFLRGLEYIDVINKECQIWEYPSGNVYIISTSKKRDNEDDDYYMNQPKEWEPKLVLTTNDAEMVKNGYLALIANL